MPALAETAQKPVRKPRSARRLHPVPDGGFLPRVAPPLPSRSAIAEFRKAAKVARVQPFAWQDIAGQYITALKASRWLYREICIIVGRQNGKSTILVPRIVMGLLRGERIMHTAQDRALPREVFEIVAAIVQDHLSASLKKVRMANGTEAISMVNGGRYRIVAPTRSGARGASNDLVILDEVQEAVDFDFVTAAGPTLTVSRSPQMIYLGSGSTEAAIVLAALRKRAGLDPQLGYLEWSAEPARDIADRTGWREANPKLAEPGEPSKTLMAALEFDFQKYTAEDRLEAFETERLCRQITSELPRLVSDVAWQRAGVGVGDALRPVLALAQDPAGRRASAAVAWKDDAGIASSYVLADVDGYPVDLEQLAKSLDPHIRRLGIREITFDPRTDQDFARHFPKAKPMQPMQYEAACEKFVRALDSGQLRYQDDDGALTADVAYTVRRETSHGWIAVPASSERPTTASLALIRAVWLATKPTPPAPRVY